MAIEVRKPGRAVKPVTANYVVTTLLAHGGYIAGRRRAVGDVIQLTQAQAQYLLLEGVIEAAPAPAAPAPTTAG